MDNGKYKVIRIRRTSDWYGESGYEAWTEDTDAGPFYASSVRELTADLRKTCVVEASVHWQIEPAVTIQEKDAVNRTLKSWYNDIQKTP
ncbi:hypothetical protein [Salisediminibacterium beveridgei]|nr:hypothetical protein [Salisediminibacterium beveridgei]